MISSLLRRRIDTTSATSYRHPNQQNPSSFSHDNPNTNILDMTAEQLSRGLAQSTDHSNFCAGEPSVETFNKDITDTSQVRRSRPEQSNFEDYQGTPTLPPTVHQAILPANPTQPPQLATTVDPYYNRGHVAYTNNYHLCPFKFFSVCHRPNRASNADNTEPLFSFRPRCQSTLPTRAIKPDLITTYRFSQRYSSNIFPLHSI